MKIGSIQPVSFKNLFIENDKKTRAKLQELSPEELKMIDRVGNDLTDTKEFNVIISGDSKPYIESANSGLYYAPVDAVYSGKRRILVTSLWSSKLLGSMGQIKNEFEFINSEVAVNAYNEISSPEKSDLEKLSYLARLLEERSKKNCDPDKNEELYKRKIQTVDYLIDKYRG